MATLQAALRGALPVDKHGVVFDPLIASGYKQKQAIFLPLKRVKK
jgi:hypothetical protein